MESTTKQPKVSVCIPLYNGGDYIREAIDSVLAQTFSSWELVITDDGSIDGSAEIAASYSDPRIRYLPNPQRLGAEGNWNRCVKEGRGIYRKLLCHDDRLHPECLARQVAVFEQAGNERLSLVASARRIINPAGKTIMTRRWKRRNQVIEGHRAILQIVRSGTNMIGEPGAVLFRASDWKMLDGFSARYPYVIDLGFWFQLLNRGNCLYMAEPLCDFRISANSWSSRLAKLQSAQFTSLIRQTARVGVSSVSSYDCLIGTCKSQLGAWIRQLIFKVACHGSR